MATTPQPQGMISPSPAKGPATCLDSRTNSSQRQQLHSCRNRSLPGKDGEERQLRQAPHRRVMSAIDEQDVVRMNRDTIYSSGVFDLEASPLAVGRLPMPASGLCLCRSFRKTISQSKLTIRRVTTPTPRKKSAHDTCSFLSGRWRILRTRRIGGCPHPARRNQDRPGEHGSFETPNWDAASQDKLRAALDALGSLGGLAATSLGTGRKSIRSRIWLLVRWLRRKPGICGGVQHGLP